MSGGQVRLPPRGKEWRRSLEQGASDALHTRAIAVPTDRGGETLAVSTCRDGNCFASASQHPVNSNNENHPFQYAASAPQLGAAARPPASSFSSAPHRQSVSSLSVTGRAAGASVRQSVSRMPERVAASRGAHIGFSRCGLDLGRVPLVTPPIKRCVTSASVRRKWMLTRARTTPGLRSNHRSKSSLVGGRQRLETAELFRLAPERVLTRLRLEGHLFN